MKNIMLLTLISFSMAAFAQEDKIAPPTAAETVMGSIKKPTKKQLKSVKKLSEKVKPQNPEPPTSTPTH